MKMAVPHTLITLQFIHKPIDLKFSPNGTCLAIACQEGAFCVFLDPRHKGKSLMFSRYFENLEDEIISIRWTSDKYFKIGENGYNTPQGWHSDTAERLTPEPTSIERILRIKTVIDGSESRTCCVGHAFDIDKGIQRKAAYRPEGCQYIKNKTEFENFVFEAEAKDGDIIITVT
jgi:hypothetical protein